MSSFNLVPMFDRVIVKEDTVAKQIGSIILPDSAQKREVGRGTILAVGPGKRDQDGETLPMSVKKGDVVLYGKFSGTELKIGDESYLSIAETDLLAVLYPDEVPDQGVAVDGSVAGGEHRQDAMYTHGLEDNR